MGDHAASFNGFKGGLKGKVYAHKVGKDEESRKKGRRRKKIGG